MICACRHLLLWRIENSNGLLAPPRRRHPPQHPPPATPLCARLFRAAQSAAAASPERPGARRSTALRGIGWCWTGAAGWGRVAAVCPRPRPRARPMLKQSARTASCCATRWTPPTRQRDYARYQAWMPCPDVAASLRANSVCASVSWSVPRVSGTFQGESGIATGCCSLRRTRAQRLGALCARPGPMPLVTGATSWSQGTRVHGCGSGGETGIRVPECLISGELRSSSLNTSTVPGDHVAGTAHGAISSPRGTASRRALPCTSRATAWPHIAEGTA